VGIVTSESDMPIIVDELVISVDVSNQAAGGAAAPPPATDEKQRIVAECVERVLDILAQKKER
jgi:uncharacterized protein DUF5908